MKYKDQLEKYGDCRHSPGSITVVGKGKGPNAQPLKMRKV